MTKPQSKRRRAPARKRRAAGGNPRGRRPLPDEVKAMTDLKYGTIAEAAKYVGRAASTIYNRVNQALDGGKEIPSTDPLLKAVVKTASGNVWVHLESLKAFFDPAALAKAGS